MAEFSGEIDTHKELGEYLEHPEQVCLAGSTQFKTWMRTGGDPKNSEQVRGDLAIESISTAISKGFRVVVVDGGSSTEFIERINEISKEATEADDGIKKYDLIVETETDKGYSGSRRQALRRAEELRNEGVKAIVMLEVEKTSITNNIEKLVKPILEGRADVVVPERGLQVNLRKKDAHKETNDEDFRGYPPYQAYSEVWANQMLNRLLVSARLKKAEDQVLDLFGGTRVIANKPEILEDFYQKHEIDAGNIKTDPKKYFDAVYAPIAYLLSKDRRVISVPIEYNHPKKQTETEIGVDNFDDKRDSQRNVIFQEMAKQIRFLGELKRYMAIEMRRFPFEMKAGFGIEGANVKGARLESIYIAETPMINASFEELKTVRKEAKNKEILIENEGRTISENLLDQKFRLFRTDGGKEVTHESVIDHEERNFVGLENSIYIIRKAFSETDVKREGFEISSWGRVYYDDKNHMWTLAVDEGAELDAAILFINSILDEYGIQMAISIIQQRDYHLQRESARLFERVFK